MHCVAYYTVAGIYRYATLILEYDIFLIKSYSFAGWLGTYLDLNI